MEDEIYVLVHTWQYDVGETGQKVLCFDSLRKAIKAMKESFEQVQDYYEERFGNNYDVDKDDMSISVYESGEYCYNHDDIIIYQREVK